MLRNRFALIVAWMPGVVLAQQVAPPQGTTQVITTQGQPGPVGRSGAAPRADTVHWRARHSPTKASVLSAVLPGAGQIYNRKHWKAPIAWAGIGTCVYFIQDNQREYRRYKDAYIATVDGDPTTVDEFGGAYSSASLLNATDTYRRWLDLSYIALGLVYMLNVIDAGVDAHFVRFDVGPDLSLGIGPSMPVVAQGGAGLSVVFALR